MIFTWLTSSFGERWSVLVHTKHRGGDIARGHRRISFSIFWLSTGQHRRLQNMNVSRVGTLKYFSGWCFERMHGGFRNSRLHEYLNLAYIHHTKSSPERTFLTLSCFEAFCLVSIRLLASDQPPSLSKNECRQDRLLLAASESAIMYTLIGRVKPVEQRSYILTEGEKNALRL